MGDDHPETILFPFTFLNSPLKLEYFWFKKSARVTISNNTCTRFEQPIDLFKNNNY